MNIIEHIDIIDDRIYAKVIFNAADALYLRFYVPANKNEFIKELKIVFNHPAITEPRFDWEEETIETYYNESLVNSAMEILHNSGHTNHHFTGVFQRKPYGVTNEGKSTYAVYLNIDALTVELIETYSSYEEALFKMLEWRAKETNDIWNFRRPTTQRKTYDATIFDMLYSIDTLDELIKHKQLYDDQLEYLHSKRLIE